MVAREERMKSRPWHSLFVWLAASAALAIATPTGVARADGKIAAMGVRSLDGEDELERKLSSALRTGAASIAGYTVSDREQSLEQMSLAYGCEEPDSRCLGEIARALSVDHLVYGTVIGSASAHELTLYLFSASPAHLESTALRGATAAQLSGAAAKDTMAALLRRLFGQADEPSAPVGKPIGKPSGGKLHVTGPAGASVIVDGRAAGVLDSSGSLRTELEPGKHTARLAGNGSSSLDDQLVLIEAGVEDTIALTVPVPAPNAPDLRVDDSESPPVDKPRRSLRKILGWTSIGIGAAFAIATIYSWVRIEKINDDPDYLAYRAAYPRANLENGVRNVCSRARAGELAASMPQQADLEKSAADLCDEARTLETLQYVFIGGTVLGAGVGTFLLLTANREPRATVRLSPRFGAQSASMAATVSF
jgi:hypothetical protein